MGGVQSGTSKQKTISFLAYHERQQQSLCGLHVVNNLLQRRAFTRFSLNRLARQLDKAERRLIDKRKRNAVLHFLTSGRAGWRLEAQNHSARGDFSVQVLQAALQSEGLDLVRVTDTDWAPRLGESWGFLVHRADHWVACRQIGDHSIWLNLDSTLAAPLIMSTDDVIALHAGLSSRGDRVTVFNVVGPTPPSPYRRFLCGGVRKLSVNVPADTVL